VEVSPLRTVRESIQEERKVSITPSKTTARTAPAETTPAIAGEASAPRNTVASKIWVGHRKDNKSKIK
jgi:hypothetical protein